MTQSPSYKECVKLLEEIYSDLEKIPNFNYAEVGYKIVDGKETNEYAIRIYIHGPKTDKNHEDSPFIPLSYGSIKTDIVATYKENDNCPKPKNDRVSIVKPLIGGISVGPHKLVSTLGVVCRSEKYGLCALTTFHNYKYKDEEVFQPSPQEGNNNYILIGKVVDHDDELDISLIQLNEKILLFSEILELINPSSFASWEEVETIYERKIKIYKSGRTTAVTSGTITSLRKSSQSITIKSENDALISCSGDSGAVWQTENGQIIGIHTRGLDNNLAKCYCTNNLIKYWKLSLIKIST